MPTAQTSTSNSVNSNTINNTNNTMSKNVKSRSKDKSVPTLSTGENNEQQTSSSTGNKTPQEQPEFIKQALIIIEKKVRNLDKRRQRLEEYKEMQRKGQNLNEDQLSAVSKFEEVIRSLELSRELEKQFVGLANDAMKQQKKQAKKEQMEREELIREKLKEAQKYISILDKFGNDLVRNDFLNEANGACKITDQELNLLDEFDKLIEPCELGAKLDESSSEVADHLINLIDGKNKPIGSSLLSIDNKAQTYNDLRKLFERLAISVYWSEARKSNEMEGEEKAENEMTSATCEPIPPAVVENVVEVEQLQLDDHRHLMATEQVLYNQQNTSDDFVLVSQQAGVVVDQFASEKTQPKTFFTTLNPADLSTQFLNRGVDPSNEESGGINFLQDSEIQLRQQDLNNQAVQDSILGGKVAQAGHGGKDASYKQKSGHHNSGGPRNYPPKQKYGDDRRVGGGNGGPPRQNNRNMNGGGGGYRQSAGNGNRPDSRPDNRNNNNYYRGSGQSGNRSGGQRGGGGYQGNHQHDSEMHQSAIIQN